MPASAQILVVEDEPSIRDNIQYALEQEGFGVVWCGTGGEGLAHLEAGNKPALIILDVGLPDISGFDVCREIRKTHHTPILFLTARADEVDRIVGLEIGGDDYVAKPFSPRELAARVRAILRRTSTIQTQSEAPGPRQSGDFIIDESRFSIRYRDQALELGRYEFRLLLTLIKRPGQVYTRSQLMDAAWEEPDASMERTVDAHIKSLRAKLRAIHAEHDPIRTHRGVGYSLEDSA